MTTVQEAGRGRKLCECGRYVGVRTVKCATCGHEFDVKGVVVHPSQQESYSPRTIRTILTPAGKCPIKLKSLAPEDMEAWHDELQDYGLRLHITYSKDALRYWLREFVDIHSQDYKTACETLENVGLALEGDIEAAY